MGENLKIREIELGTFLENVFTGGQRLL